jgi:hypothetical protein
MVRNKQSEGEGLIPGKYIMSKNNYRRKPGVL